MSLAQLGDPPRVLPVQQYDTFVEPDVYQQPMATVTPNEVDVDVHHVRHAVVIFLCFGKYMCLFSCFKICHGVCLCLKAT